MIELIPLLCGAVALVVPFGLALALRWRRMQVIVPQLIGAWITLAAYLFLDWVRFAPWSFLGSHGLDLAGEIAPSLLSTLRSLSHYERVFGFLRHLLGISGPWATLIQLNFNPFLRLSLAAPAIVAVAALVAGIWSPSISRQARVALGWGQVLLVGLALLFLVGHLNYLDAWGGNKVLATNVLALFVGARVGLGPYWTIIGLLILMLAGVWQTAWDEGQTAAGPAVY